MKRIFQKLFARTRKAESVEISDLVNLPGVDDAIVREFFSMTNKKSMKLPLLIAGYVVNQYQDRLTKPVKLDALAMAEIRGAMKAMRLFATYYHNGIEDWLGRGGRGDA